MICAGSGVAPFRGFVEERAIVKRSGRTVGLALPFFGGDAPDVDFLYREEFAAWQAEGVRDLRMAFSEVRDRVRFVQHRVWENRADVAAFFGAGTRCFIGEGRFMAPAVRAILSRIAGDHLAVDEDRSAHLLGLAERSGRVAFDVFALGVHPICRLCAPPQELSSRTAKRFGTQDHAQPDLLGLGSPLRSGRDDRVFL